MTRIKICGITRVDDAIAAANAGADALGFIGVPSSPRYISPERYQEISQSIPIFVSRVVVVQRPEDADDYLPEYVQYYDETTDKSRFRRSSSWRIKAFRMVDEATVGEIAAYAVPVGAILLDTYHKEMLGGSGETFNWQLASQVKAITQKPIILAGGLTHSNVVDALETVHPYAVDVSSGVEISPGIKDHAKVEAFVRAVKDWDLVKKTSLGG